MARDAVAGAHRNFRLAAIESVKHFRLPVLDLLDAKVCGDRRGVLQTDSFQAGDGLFHA